MTRLFVTADGGKILAEREEEFGIEDVTSDALKAVIEFIGIGETRVVTVDGKPVLTLSVQVVEEGK